MQNELLYEVQEEVRDDDIQDDEEAESALSAIRKAREDAEKWKRFYTDRMQQAKQRAEAREAYQMARLRRYFDRLPDGARRKTRTQLSYALPGGTLVLKKQQPKYERDDAAMLPFLAQEAPACVETKQTVRWAELKKRLAPGTTCLTDTGEAVPGLTCVEQDAAFTLTFTSEGNGGKVNE